MARKKNAIARRKSKNLGPLGWVGVGVASLVGVGVVLGGVVFYRMTRM